MLIFNLILVNKLIKNLNTKVRLLIEKGMKIIKKKLLKRTAFN